MQLFVKTLIGKTITVEVNPQDTIEMVKEKIHEAESSIKIGKMGLVLNNKQLDNSDSLERHGIDQDGMTIHLVIK
jgi:ubiquitin-large subunit ribosomal protein L40e